MSFNLVAWGSWFLFCSFTAVGGAISLFLSGFDNWRWTALLIAVAAVFAHVLWRGLAMEWKRLKVAKEA